MRAYIPTTVGSLGDWIAAGVVPTDGRSTVDDDVIAAAPDGDEEEWEYLAYLRAIDAGADLLRAAPDQVRRRIVLAAELPSADDSQVSWSAVVSAHVDAQDVELDAAELDDDLLWFSPAEVPELLARLTNP